LATDAEPGQRGSSARRLSLPHIGWQGQSAAMALNVCLRAIAAL